MTSPTDDSILSTEQDANDSREPTTSAEPEDTTANEFVPPLLLFLTFTLLPDDQNPDGRLILPGIHSPDEVAHLLPMFRETQLGEVQSRLPNWITEYEQVLAQRQIERAKAEAAKPKLDTTAKSKTSMNQRPAHVESTSKPTTTKEVRGTQRSLFDLSS
ncbi:hypothetical protein [Leptolyngbya sp. NIES-2104]|uniref:hypothetical protein n=1 Tax=Leptolyngbya sp. NIES-2104 TaxID=1552121 RepID=UPI0006ECBC13|nr:hypothetical protein [Leptolyngbya sp. NIES-2104]GAP99736.1 hypothetical protein NIES2104_63020 [Leptolyngbya sp. NIES-2104]